MEEQARGSGWRANPLVEEFLSEGGGKVVALGGFLGPATDGRVRIYASLRLGTYVDLAESDVVRVVEAERPSDPSTVYFRRDAEITYVQSATMRADEALAAAAAAPVAGQAGCGCASDTDAAVARQTGGGPAVDICAWACVERMRICEATSGPIGKLWCYLTYGFCRLGCIDPPIIAV
jgi:hypothetical protein